MIAWVYVITYCASFVEEWARGSDTHQYIALSQPACAWGTPKCVRRLTCVIAGHRFKQISVGVIVHEGRRLIWHRCERCHRPIMEWL